MGVANKKRRRIEKLQVVLVRSWNEGIEAANAICAESCWYSCTGRSCTERRWPYSLPCGCNLHISTLLFIEKKRGFVEILKGEGKFGSGRVWMLLHVKYGIQVSSSGGLGRAHLCRLFRFGWLLGRHLFTVLGRCTSASNPRKLHWQGRPRISQFISVRWGMVLLTITRHIWNDSQRIYNQGTNRAAVWLSLRSVWVFLACTCTFRRRTVSAWYILPNLLGRSW